MKKHLKAFTFLEILVAFFIVGVVISIIFIGLNSARGKTRDAKRISDLNNLKTALHLYYINNGAYPETPPGQWCPIAELGETDTPCADFLRDFDEKLKPYLDKMPQDPLYPKEEDGKKYSYQYRTIYLGQEYKIHADLETREPYEVYSSKGLAIVSESEEAPLPHLPLVLTLDAGCVEMEIELRERRLFCNLTGEIINLGSGGRIIERGFQWRGDVEGSAEMVIGSWTETVPIEEETLLGPFFHSDMFSPANSCTDYYYQAMVLDPIMGWAYGEEMPLGLICPN